MKAARLMTFIWILVGTHGFRDFLRTNTKPTQAEQVNPYAVCGNIRGLTSLQAHLCAQFPTSVASALQGMEIAIHECKYQFKYNRWNCSALEIKNSIPHSSTFLSSGTGYRETAFSYAIASAGVAHQVAYACSLGKIEECGCVQPRQKLLTAHQRKIARKKVTEGDIKIFEKSGCDHNINYGIEFSGRFLDSRETSHDLIAQTRLHNNRVGRLIVANNMRRSCKCHGQSGSCSQKTCWRTTPNFKEVGEAIKKKYENAITILPHVIRNQASDGNSVKVTQTYERQFPLESLVYFEDSPSFCKASPFIAVPGTRGRYCNKTAGDDEPNSCKNLCCNRGHFTYNETRIERCHCRFYWCCYVVCDTCEWTEQVSVCK